MGGKGGKVVGTVNVVFHAVEHAIGWLKGIAEVVNPVISYIQSAVDWIEKVYNNIVKWAKDTFGPIIDAWNKFWKWWDTKVQPIIDQTVGRLQKIYEAFYVFKSAITGKIENIFNYIYAKIEPRILKLENALRSLQQFTSIFSKTLADEIGKVRQTIYDWTLKKLYDLEVSILSKVNQVFLPVEKFLAGLEAFRTKYIDPLYEGLKGLRENLGNIITPEGKPQKTFSADVVDTGLKEFWDEYLRAHPKPHVYVGPPIIEIDEIYKELEATTSDDPDKLPREEKEIYEALEEEVAGY